MANATDNRDRGDGRVYQRKGSSRWWIQYSVNGQQFRESGGKTEDQARKKLKARLREAARDDFAGPAAERVSVDRLLDNLLRHLENSGRRSVNKTRSHLKAVYAFFGGRRAVSVTTDDVERYKRERREAGKATATVDRELEGLRQAYRHAAGLTPPLYPRNRIPNISFFRADNVRQGFFTLAEVEALLARIPDADVRDFISWGFRTGMRKGEIARLTWEMLDRGGEPWVLRAPGAITKNGRGRSIGLQGEVRTILERRLKARRFDCALIFHRVSKGKPGQPVKAFDLMWRNALAEASLPPGRIFHDLRRSAVRTLISSGVDPQMAMKVSGHKTQSMLARYNVTDEMDSAAALAKADAWLSTQPKTRNVEQGQFGDIRMAVGAELQSHQHVLAEAGGNRTHRCRCQPAAGRL
jgi:integrase